MSGDQPDTPPVTSADVEAAARAAAAADPLEFAGTATDEAWSIVSGHCGACGNDCHPGYRCTPGEAGCRWCGATGGRGVSLP